MDLPNYMIIICNLSGDVIQKPDEVDIKTIFDIIDDQSLPEFHDYIKSIFQDGKYIQVRRVHLNNDSDYYLNTEILNSKIVFQFNKCTVFDPESEDKFWMDTVFKYEYYLKRNRNVVISISKLIENFFYKNRSDIEDILKDLHSSLNIQHSLLLFRNGRDHILYCKDEISTYKCDYLDKDLHYLDSKFEEKVVARVTDVLIIKKYEDTYIHEFVKDKSLDRKNVYVLKLMFGPKTIGYYEFIPHNYIMLTPTELSLIQSLSSILAYIINNKNEQLEIENYIKEKLVINK